MLTATQESLTYSNQQAPVSKRTPLLLLPHSEHCRPVPRRYKQRQSKFLILILMSGSLLWLNELATQKQTDRGKEATSRTGKKGQRIAVGTFPQPMRLQNQTVVQPPLSTTTLPSSYRMRPCATHRRLKEVVFAQGLFQLEDLWKALFLSPFPLFYRLQTQYF